ncbi:MAG: thermosome subunit [Candidatus Lokiarchaeota archaeon]|nr:thermosome subunit [Candidatus Lokiarchaeota archaeon]
MTRLVGPPVQILKEGSKRIEGEDAQRVNIRAARTISESLKSTLGPRGLDKMLIDRLGGIVITNDGATILEEMDVQHPIGRLLVEIARAQDDEVGDGTTSVIVIIGELLKRIELLLDLNVHPSSIVKGLKIGGVEAKKILKNSAKKVNLDENNEILIEIAKTSLNSKLVAKGKEKFAEFCVKAALKIQEKRDSGNYIQPEDVKIIKMQGKSLLDSEFIEGIIIQEELLHPLMPKQIKNAKIALLHTGLEIEKSNIDTAIEINDPEQINALLEEEENTLRRYAQKIIEIGANVVISQKSINDFVQEIFVEHGILALKRIKRKDMNKIVRAVGGTVVTFIDDLEKKDLGYAGLVQEIEVGRKKMVVVKECSNPKSVSILLRGSIDKMIDEAERAIHDGICVIGDLIKNNYIIPGGGAIEVELARKLRKHAQSIGGREQLAIEALAESFEIIPKTLAINSGFDPIDKIIELRAKHEEVPGSTYGINVYNGKIEEMLEKNKIIEPLEVKLQQISSIVEAVSMILRIDDVVAAKLISPEAKSGAPMANLPPGYRQDPTSGKILKP